MSQILNPAGTMLIEKCDRCGTDEPRDSEILIKFGGRTFGSTLFFDLCSACAYDIRVFLHTAPQ